MASFEWPDKGSSGGSGDVVGPALSTDNAVALFDGATGKLLKNSVVIVNAGAVSGITSLTMSGALSGVTTLSMSGALTLSGLTADRAVYLNGSKEMVSSTTSGTELNYVTGVTSAIQTQLNAKISTTLTDGNILVGSGANVATSVAMSGEATIINTGAVTLSNAAVIAKVLTGYVKGAGTVAATDSILQAIQKLDGNADGKISTSLADGNIIVGNGSGVAASVAMSGEATIINTGAVTLSNAAVIAKVLTGYTSGAGTVAATDTILEAIQKLNGNDLLKQPLATLTTKGDLYAATGASTVVRLAAGTNGYVLKANSGATEGLAYDVPVDMSDALVNCGLAASVGSSALTIAVKTKAGNDASSTDPIFVAFPSATITSGQYSMLSLTAALSLVISSGSTLGQKDATSSNIYVFLINDSGTLRLGVCRLRLPEDRLYTTVSEGGAGAADLSYELYSSGVYSNVRIRCIGRITSTQATAGTWATAPSAIICAKRSELPIQEIFARYTRATALTVSGVTVVPFLTLVEDNLSLYDTSTGELYVPFTLKYSMSCVTRTATASFGATDQIATYIYVDGAEVQGNLHRTAAAVSSNFASMATAELPLTKAGVVTFRHLNSQNADVVASVPSFNNFSFKGYL